MKVALHVQLSSQSLGGAEVMAATMAAIIQRHHPVEIVHHRPDLTLDRLQQLSGVVLEGVRLRYVDRRPNYFTSSSSSPWRMWREPLSWGREVAADADALISMTHELPTFNPTAHGLLVLLFPMSSPLTQWPLSASGGGVRSVLSTTLHRWRYRRLWRSYDVKTAISTFTQTWAQQRWGIACDILHPPIDCTPTTVPKEDVVLMLGRFAVSGVSKHQLDLAAAFARARGLESWRLVCMGEARTRDEVVYAQEVAQQGDNVTVITNAARSDVQAWLARARVFWHAAGLTEDPDTHPERMEHFGMSTVEAMAHGCVPVVLGRGGQPEIVADGQSGRCVQSVNEMIAATVNLATDPSMARTLARAAVTRAQDFSAPRFEAALRSLAPFLFAVAPRS